MIKSKSYRTVYVYSMPLKISISTMNSAWLSFKNFVNQIKPFAMTAHNRIKNVFDTSVWLWSGSIKFTKLNSEAECNWGREILSFILILFKN